MVRHGDSQSRNEGGMSHFLVRISTVAFLLGSLLIVCYSGLDVLGFDLNIFFVKIKAMLVGRSCHFLISRLGWCTGGLILAVIYPLFDPSNVGNMMAPSGGEVTPYSGPSGPSSSSSWKEDSFEIQVLLEPFSETDTEGTSVNPPIPRVAGEEAGPSHQPSIVHNASFESSLHQRIQRLENENTSFLLDKVKGEYWTDIKRDLDLAPSQLEYNRLLEFENRDLQIREHKHACYALLQETLKKHPYLLENAVQSDPTDALLSFFQETREELDEDFPQASHLADREEMRILVKVYKNIREEGPKSFWVNKFLGNVDKKEDDC